MSPLFFMLRCLVAHSLPGDLPATKTHAEKLYAAMLAAKKSNVDITIAEVWLAYRDAQPAGTWAVIVNPSAKRYVKPQPPKAIRPPPAPKAVEPTPAQVVPPKPRRPFVPTFCEPERRKNKRQLIREGLLLPRYDNEQF